jgi:ATP/maltotriose-dependent transcriptional regulator MalT
MPAPDNQRFDAIDRPRVSLAIERTLAGFPVAAFIAPGGFGKTIAIAHVLARRDRPYVRFALDRRHADVAGFARGLAGALSGAEPSVIGDLTTPAPVEPLDVLERFLERTDCSILLDDFAVAAGDPRIVELLERSIERDRGRRSWFVATRDAASLPVARWCAAGLLDEPVDERELRFDAADASELARAAGLGARAEFLVPLLLEVTDGWPCAIAAGIRAALSDDDTALVIAATRRAMFDRLERFVFAPSSTEKRRFLISTCLFDELSSDALAELGTHAPALLAEVRAETTLVGHGGEGSFRYHPTLRDFLRAKLEREGGDSFERVARSTVQTLAAIGRYAEGARLALHGEPAAIAATLGACGPALVERGDVAVVREALAALPAELRDADPGVLILRALVGDVAPVDAFEERYRAALAAAAGADAYAELALGFAALLARTGRAAEAADLLGTVDLASVSGAAVRARVLADLVAFGARDRAVDAADDARIAEAIALSDATGDAPLAAHVNRRAAETFAAGRRFDEAVRHASLAVDIASRCDASRTELRARAALYAAFREIGRVESARFQLDALTRGAAQRNDLEMTLFALAAASELAAEAGDSAWLDERDAAFVTAGDPGHETFVEALGARFGDALVHARALHSAGNGRFAEALAHLDALPAGAVPASLATDGERALYAAACGDETRANDARASVRRRFSEAPGDLSRDAIIARLLIALASVLAQNGAGCGEELEMLDERADRIPLPLLCFMRAVRAAHAYATNRASRRALLDATAAMRRFDLGGYAAAIEALPIRAALVVVATTLTPSESRVLELLCDGLTSREIGNRLGRSTLTIDSHVKSIVRKLHCSGGRREAVELARAGRVAGFPPSPAALAV